MSRDEMVSEIRSALDYVRSNIRELGSQIWDKKERDKVVDLISDIREYINEKRATPPMTHVHSMVAGGREGRKSLDKMFRLATIEKNGFALRHFPKAIIQRLESWDRWEPPKEKPPDTFYLHEMHPSKTDQSGETFRTSTTDAARRVRRNKQHIRDKTAYRDRGYTKPEVDEEEIARKNKEFWKRILGGD